VYQFKLIWKNLVKATLAQVKYGWSN